MTTGEKKTIPVAKGLWTIPSIPDEKPQLIGDKCLSCGEVFFPKCSKGRCIHCYSTNLEEIKLSRRGKIHSFSVVMIQPGGGYYHGPVPYAYGCVDLPEGIRIETLFIGNLESLKVGMDVELVVEKLGEDEEGNEIIAYKFKPV